jgi:SAM-dependent methyltransferase
MNQRYDSQFFDYMVEGSQQSARVVVPIVQQWLPVRSVLDVGCGQGAWLKIWQDHGVGHIEGLDGAHVDRAQLLIPPASFHAVDLERAFALDRRFDLVTCLEVAEHLPHASATPLVTSLCAHADHVLFSAALPGTGGAHHINEQPHDYWKTRFEQAGFVMLDCMRPLVASDERVKRWYRYNLFLYVRAAALPALPESIRRTIVSAGEVPADVSPLWFKARKAVIRLLPVPVVSWLAAVNERTFRL